AHGLGLGRRFDDNQLAAALYWWGGAAALLGLGLARAGRAFGVRQAGMRLGFTHAVQVGAAHGAAALGRGRPGGGENRLGVRHFSFGLALDAVSFHHTSILILGRVGPPAR